jgi:hypothetical protein
LRRREIILFILIFLIILIVVYDKKTSNYIRVKPANEVVGMYSERRVDPEERVNKLIDEIGKGVKNLAKKKEQDQ